MVNPGQSQQVQAKNDDTCKKKGCGQPHGQSCKNPNPHKTWCGGKDGDEDEDDETRPWPTPESEVGPPTSLIEAGRAPR
jgi:hypothetical protein